MNNINNNKKLYDYLKKETAPLSPEKLDEVIKKEKRIKEKLKLLDKIKFPKLFYQLQLSLEMIKDYKNKKYRTIPWRSVGLVVLAVLYFLNPFDLMPDLMPVLGYTDDAIAVAAIFKSLQEDLKNYCVWKNYNVEKYFS
ncbi:MAG: DUF1232 domain-containing protein [Ignavibacteria bacterium]|nr:DUF1232 domain-containing protein [Ignavibacteria bacterium]